MKKTLIALAAVAVTGAAFAQNVTLSGTLDIGFQKRWSGDAFAMTGDRNGTSNWTLSGSEDLGGGLKANFKISTAFNPDNGTAGNATTGANNGFGNNDMWVEVAGGFGQVRLGRPVHILWGNVLSANGTKGVSLHAASSLLGGTATGAGATSRTGGAGNAVYADNAVQYLSPAFGGFSVQLEYAPDEAAGGQNGTGVALRYNNGPIAASFVNYKAASAVKTKAVNQYAFAYNFGVARVLFTMRDQSGVASDVDTSYALGLTAPVGTGTAYLSYNVSEQVGDDARTVLAGYKYPLSKRTQVYFNYANRNSAWAPGAAVTGPVATVPTKSSSGYGFGVQHNF